ncbi:hypothetical protein T492DRAFT_270110 [Pavlovales sp. CCMP2436]|nr:hypothetical protein T492DRAFT_270110 [Pavlovales sp. CCMP2436]
MMNDAKNRQQRLTRLHASRRSTQPPPLLLLPPLLSWTMKPSPETTTSRAHTWTPRRRRRVSSQWSWLRKRCARLHGLQLLPLLYWRAGDAKRTIKKGEDSCPSQRDRFFVTMYHFISPLPPHTHTHTPPPPPLPRLPKACALSIAAPESCCNLSDRHREPAQADHA